MKKKNVLWVVVIAAAVAMAAGGGIGNGEGKQEDWLSAPKVQAEEPGPKVTLSPIQKEKVSLKQDGLCYYKTTAGETWRNPKEYGYEESDPVYELFAFEQEFDGNGNAKYTDIVVPREIDGAPVIDCNSFIDHYEIKSLRVQAAYSGWRDYSTRSQEEDILFCRVSGCKNLEYYEMADDTDYLDDIDLKGCTSLKEIVIPKGMKSMEDGAFGYCENLKSIKFDDFSNLDCVDALKDLPWWWDKCVRKNGMVIYKKCLLDAGKGSKTVTIHGNKIKKIMSHAFEKSKAKTVKLVNVKELSEETFWGSNVEKIIVGKETDPVIPAGCFGSTRSLKELHIMSRKKLIWGPEPWGYSGLCLFDDGKDKIDIYIHSDKFHTASMKEWSCGKNVTVHVPKKVVAKYRKYTKCTVVAL